MEVICGGCYGRRKSPSLAQSGLDIRWLRCMAGSSQRQEDHCTLQVLVMRNVYMKRCYEDYYRKKDKTIYKNSYYGTICAWRAHRMRAMKRRLFKLTFVEAGEMTHIRSTCRLLQGPEFSSPPSP